MTDDIALLRLFPAADAPGYRGALATRSQYVVEDFGDGIVGVVPTEGAGVTRKSLSLTRICDASTDLDDPAVWRSLKDNPPHVQRDIPDPAAYLQEMQRKGQEIIERNDCIESRLAAFALQTLGAMQNEELDVMLRANLPGLFDAFPGGSLWQVVVDPVLLSRLALGRTQLALQLTPDMPVGADRSELNAFSDLTLTRGIDFGPILNVALLAFSPAVLGFVIRAVPTTLAFCFGDGLDLRRPVPSSFASLYRPGTLDDAEGLDRSALLADQRADDGERLLTWWVDRLNQIYSHATDPTQFTDGHGYYDAAAQTAWMVTVERMLADALSLLAEPQATDLDRVQIAFDLLDKAESLLGYRRDETGKGFGALLRQGQSARRAREALSSLPDDLSERLADEIDRLFDGLRTTIRDNTLSYRLTNRGARIARDSADALNTVDDDTLVASLCRAVRNSSHGLLDTLRGHPDRFLLAANSGGIPAELAALAPLIALGLVADVDALIDGSWRARLTHQP